MDFFAVGHAAYYSGAASAAPALNAEVQAALAGRAVGDPENLRVMNEFSRGWHAAAEEVAAAVLAAETAPPSCELDPGCEAEVHNPFCVEYPGGPRCPFCDDGRLESGEEMCGGCFAAGAEAADAEAATALAEEWGLDLSGPWGVAVVHRDRVTRWTEDGLADQEEAIRHAVEYLDTVTAMNAEERRAFAKALREVGRAEHATFTAAIAND